jgi:hypothetical protein
MNRNHIVRITIRWLALNVNPDPEKCWRSVPIRLLPLQYLLLKADYSGNTYPLLTKIYSRNKYSTVDMPVGLAIVGIHAE